MAHNDDIAKIIIAPTVERRKSVRCLVFGDTIRWARETPMEQVWPDGDPVARDKEMLVEWITEEEFINEQTH